MGYMKRLQMPFEWFRGDWLTRVSPHVRILVPIFDAMWGNKVRTLHPASLVHAVSRISYCDE